MTLRTPRVPLARRDQDARSTLIGVVLRSRALGVLVEESFQRIRDLAVGLLRRVLVDQDGPHTVVTHPGHEVSKRPTAVGGEQVAGVPQIVEVQPGAPRQRRAQANPGLVTSPGVEGLSVQGEPFAWFVDSSPRE